MKNKVSIEEFVNAAVKSNNSGHAIGVDAEYLRISNLLQQRMNYWAETIVKMGHLDCKEGERTAFVALEILRDFQIEMVNISSSQYDIIFGNDEEAK